MRTLRTYAGLLPQDRGACLAIGNFDGVHLGHRAVVAQTGAQARTMGAPLGILTFEPHPREHFAPQTPPFRMMNAAARAHRLAQLGVDLLYELPFDAAMAGLDAGAFAREVLAQGLGARHVIVGRDFRFGRDRGGDAAGLVALGAAHGFDVTLADAVDTGGVTVSSTRIRAALSDGRPQDAATMLGHLHRIEGPVLHGDKRGRTLGYPTANMGLDNLHLPAFGVYAVRVQVLDGRHAGAYDGVASLGVRPMFGENVPNLETMLFDFDGDLYGQHLSVGLVAHLRGEARFDSLEALIAQMDADSAQARAILETP